MTRHAAAIVVGGMMISGAVAGGRQDEPPQMTELDTLAKFTRADKSVEYKQMDFAQFKEFQAQCQRWTAVYPQALELAEKDWNAAGSHAGKPFPTDRLAPCKMELVDRLGASDHVKPTRSPKNGEAFISKETAERTYVVPEKWEALLNKNFEARDAKTDAEKQRNAETKDAAALVMEKLQMLEGANKDGNTGATGAKPGAHAAPAPKPWAASAEPSKELPLAGEVFSVKGCTAFLIPPERAAVSNGAPWVWYAPTLPGLPGPEEKWMFQQFAKAGIAVAGIDVGESYGNPTGRALFSALYDELVSQRGLSRTPCLLARSRGGLMLYNWAVEHPASVAGIAGIYPVCNLSSYPGIAKACGAYDMTEAQLVARLSEHNPIDRLAPLAAAHVPLYHIHGDSDKVVPLEKNSGALAQRYLQLGGAITLNVVPGQGHNHWPGWFQCQALVDFVIAHAH